MLGELSQQLKKLKQGDHACPIYETPAEQLAVAVPFIMEGLSRGERCLYIGDEGPLVEIEQALTAAGVDVARERERHALQLLTKWDTYIESGEFAPNAMIDYLRRAESKALAGGFHGSRVVGAMTWALGPESGVHRVIEYEALLNHFLLDSRSVILCQYNRLRFGPDVIHDILRTHPIALFGGEVYSNPYCEPPELVLSQETLADSDVPAKRVNWWISQLKRARAAERERERREEELRIREQRERARLTELEQIYRNAPVGLCFLDANLRFVRINEQLASMNGMSVAEHVGRTIREVVPNIADDMELLYRGVIATGEPMQNVEIHGTTAAELDKKRDWLGSYFPLKSSDGTIIGVSAAVVEITERKTAERTLAQYAERLQALSGRLLDIQEHERRFLARELHDEIGQTLTGLRLLLKPKDELGPHLKSKLEQAQALVDELLARVRGLSFDLRPATLDQLGLLPALVTLFERYTDRTGVLVDFKHNQLGDRFNPEVETASYRVVQEALTNVARHAGVGVVFVRIWASAGLLGVKIEDQGVGFDPEVALAAPQSSGLSGMRERVLLLGGHFTIDARPGGPTQIVAEIPIETSSREGVRGNLNRSGLQLAHCAPGDCR